MSSTTSGCRCRRSTLACCLPPARGCSRPTACFGARASSAASRAACAALLDSMDAVDRPLRARGARLVSRRGSPAERVRVIPHGAFDYLTRLPDEAPLPDELAAVEDPVILCFGLIRPYKGVDVLLEAFRSVEGAELWVVGRPLGMSVGIASRAGRRARAGRCGFVPRFVTDQRAPGLLSPRRPGGAAVPRRRAVRRPVRGARLRQADRDERRRRIRRGRGARVRARSCPPGDPEAARRAAVSELLRRRPRRASKLAACRAGRRRGAVLVGRRRRADHGALRGARAVDVRGRRLLGVGRRCSSTRTSATRRSCGCWLARGRGDEARHASRRAAARASR